MNPSEYEDFCDEMQSKFMTWEHERRQAEYALNSKKWDEVIASIEKEENDLLKTNELIARIEKEGHEEDLRHAAWCARMIKRVIVMVQKRRW